MAGVPLFQYYCRLGNNTLRWEASRPKRVFISMTIGDLSMGLEFSAMRNHGIQSPMITDIELD